MADDADLGGVRTWYDERGEGEPLALLHGGSADARFFDRNVDALADRFHVFLPERRGHGHTPDVDGPITYELMAQDTIAFLEAVVGGPADLVGHSDGAVVAMLVALRRPDLARQLVLISGGFHHDGLMPGMDQLDVDEVVKFAGPAYGEVSPDGAEHFPVVVEKIARMAAEEPALPQSELRGVTSRTLVMFGDDDLMTLEHVIAMYEGIPNAELAVVPGTSHFLPLPARPRHRGLRHLRPRRRHQRAQGPADWQPVSRPSLIDGTRGAGRDVAVRRGPRSSIAGRRARGRAVCVPG